jgi:hypothetical protein
MVTFCADEEFRSRPFAKKVQNPLFREKSCQGGMRRTKRFAFAQSAENESGFLQPI